MSAAPAAAIGVGRLARATPDGYTIDIGQWDTHVGAIIYNLNYDLQTDFAPIGLISHQSDAVDRAARRCRRTISKRWSPG